MREESVPPNRGLSAIRLCIVSLFVALGVLAGLGGRSRSSRITGAVTSALLAIVYFYTSPSRRGQIPETLKEVWRRVPEDGGQVSDRLDEIKAYIRHAIESSPEPPEPETQDPRWVKAARACLDMYPLTPEEIERCWILERDIKRSESNRYPLTDRDLSALRGLPALYANHVLALSGNKVSVDSMEFAYHSAAAAELREHR
jgi:hypothetical protein